MNQADMNAVIDAFKRVGEGFEHRDKVTAKNNEEILKRFNELHEKLNEQEKQIKDLQESVGDLYLTGTDSKDSEGE